MSKRVNEKKGQSRARTSRMNARYYGSCDDGCSLAKLLVSSSLTVRRKLLRLFLFFLLSHFPFLHRGQAVPPPGDISLDNPALRVSRNCSSLLEGRSKILFRTLIGSHSDFRIFFVNFCQLVYMYPHPWVTPDSGGSVAQQIPVTV